MDTNPGAWRTTTAALEFAQLPQESLALPAPFNIGGTDYRATLLFDTDADLDRWVEWIRLDDVIDDPEPRAGGTQMRTTFVHDGIELELIGFVRNAAEAAA